MAWEQPMLNGFEGLGSFFAQVSPYLFPILLLIFAGSLFVFVGKLLVGTVSHG
jgi:hypothetical protein